MKIIKNTNIGGITNGKAGKDGMEMILLEVSGSFRIGIDLKLHGKKDGTGHVIG